MTEKKPRLLTSAKELIKNNNFSEAVILCEEIIKLDPINVNGLLLATKCWMELNINEDKVKDALEEVLILNPNNTYAIQGLRKFYEKYLNLYYDNALIFYKNLSNKNALIDKDFEVIFKMINQPTVSTETEKFICDCLLLRIESEKDINSLKILFHIGAQKLIINGDRYYFNHFSNIISHIDSKNTSSDVDEVDYLKANETLFQAYINKMEPEFFFSLFKDSDLMNEVYGYILFARILCDHYVFSDCHETLELGFDKLNSSFDLVHSDDLYKVLKIIQIENLINWTNVLELQSCWPENAIDFLPKHLWCFAWSIGFDVFTQNHIKWDDVMDIWCSRMSPVLSLLCVTIMKQLSSDDAEVQVTEALQNHLKLSETDLTSVQWYSWATIMKKYNLKDQEHEALKYAANQNPTYYKVHARFAELSQSNKDFKSAETHLMMALESHFCQDILDILVALHMDQGHYLESVDILEKLEIDFFSESLLEKFVQCLDKIGRMNDAISIAQRLTKSYPTNGLNSQLLGDLYLKRGNTKSAQVAYTRSMQLLCESSDIHTRLANVMSILYEQSREENDYHKAISEFDKALSLDVTAQAIEGKCTVLYLHAQLAVRQLMFGRAVKDLQNIIDSLIHHSQFLGGSELQYNLLGKSVFLSIYGSIDILMNFKELTLFLALDTSIDIDSFQLAFSCFSLSINKYPENPDSFMNYGLLGFHKLNRLCSGVERGSTCYPDIYKESEYHFKRALYLDQSMHEAWKYLGYLYFRHGVVTGRHVFDIQHCLSTTINITMTTDSIRDPESAFILGLLYIQENWCSLAKEVFARIQLDYPVNPIGYIGMYLLGAKDHTVAEQSHIAKAILCYNYRDEESYQDDNISRISDSIVGLFCDNLGFLVNSRCDYSSFDSPESSSVLISALKNALSHVFIKFMSRTSIGLPMSATEHKQYNEYGCFLGVLELLSGNHESGRRLIEKSKDDSNDSLCTKLSIIMSLYDAWNTNNRSGSLRLLASLLKQSGLEISPGSDHPKSYDRLLLTCITQFLSESSDQLIFATKSLVDALEPVDENDEFPDPSRISVLTGLGSLIVATANQSLAAMFVSLIDRCYRILDDSADSFCRVLCRVRALDTGPESGLRYLYSHCAKQPYDMARWLTLLEFGLEYSERLPKLGDLPRLFFVTNRPWCFTTFDIERYATILYQYRSVLTAQCLSHHRHMVLHSMRLFPNLLVGFYKYLLPKL